MLYKLAGHARSTARSALDDLVATVFPCDCRICGHPLLRSTVLPVCDRCRASVVAQTTVMCHRCGEALDMDMESVRLAKQFSPEGVLCSDCRAEPPMFERAVAYAAYRDELRAMIHLLKYERMRGVSNLLGGRLAESILTLRTDAAPELAVVAVPLFAAKQRQRGYNQADLLADAAVRELRRLAPEWRLRRASGVLTRRRDTASQFELTPVGRQRNIEGAFAVDATNLPVGCEVLLIDDIYTTGATARECSRMLRQAGAKKVWVATLSRAQRAQVAAADDVALLAPQGFG